MSKQELLQQYKKDVENLRKCAKALNLADGQITGIFRACFVALDRETESSNQGTKAQKYFCTTLKVLLLVGALAVSVYVLLNVHQPTSSIVLRNVQGLIYPGLKVLRFLSVPVIKTFPALTDLYDESCLVENPFFYVSDMECWPCENVHSVMDLTGFDNHSLYQSGVPYVAKTNQPEVFFETLQQVYFEHKTALDREADNVKTTNPAIASLEDLFGYNLKSSTTHVTWRLNKMVPARLVRTLFPRPYIISERAGQSIERYIMVDEPKAAPYSLPNTECSYVFVIQGSGERTVILKPSRECGDACRTVSVVLKSSYVLWYNWWYWRPISLPSENATQASITYISSYC